MFFVPDKIVTNLLNLIEFLVSNYIGYAPSLGNVFLINRSKNIIFYFDTLMSQCTLKQHIQLLYFNQDISFLLGVINYYIIPIFTIKSVNFFSV